MFIDSYIFIIVIYPLLALFLWRTLIQASRISFQNFYLCHPMMDTSQSFLITLRINNTCFYFDKYFYNLAPAHFFKLIPCLKRSPWFLIIELHPSFF